MSEATSEIQLIEEKYSNSKDLTIHEHMAIGSSQPYKGELMTSEEFYHRMANGMFEEDMRKPLGLLNKSRTDVLQVNRMREQKKFLSGFMRFFTEESQFDLMNSDMSPALILSSVDEKSGLGTEALEFGVSNGKELIQNTDALKKLVLNEAGNNYYDFAMASDNTVIRLTPKLASSQAGSIILVNAPQTTRPSGSGGKECSSFDLMSQFITFRQQISSESR